MWTGRPPEGHPDAQACGIFDFLSFDFLNLDFLNLDFLKFDFLAGNGDTSSSYIHRLACGLESRGPARQTAASNCTEQP
jgi:hypothetical protein